MKKRYMTSKQKFFIYLIFVTYGVMAESVSDPQITIVSEQNPPYAYINKEGKFEGTSVTKLKKIMKLADISYEMKIYPWKRALGQVEKHSNMAIHPLSRIAQREKHFNWIIPLQTERYQIYGLAGTFDPNNIDIKSGKYTFVCSEKTILCIALKKLGVPEHAITVISGVNDRQMINMVLHKRVNFTMIAEVGLLLQLNEMNIHPSRLIPMKQHFFEVEEYLAGNLDFDPVLIEKIRKAQKLLSK